MSEQQQEPRPVSLRSWQQEDREFLAELMTDAEVRRFLGGPVEPQEAIRRSSRLTEDTPWGYFVVVDGSDSLGTVTFDRKRGPWEVSFQLRRSVWGQGVMTSALRAAIAWFRHALPDQPLIAVTQARNKAARRTIERSGGRHVRDFEQYGELQAQYEF